MTQSPKSCVTIEIGRTLVDSTEKAVCFMVNNKKEWFPKQGTRYSLEQGRLSCQYWIAEKKGLIKTPVSLSNQLTSPAPQKTPIQNQAPQKPVIQKLALLEELSKLTAEVKLINQRLIVIQRELSKEN